MRLSGSGWQVPKAVSPAIRAVATGAPTGGGAPVAPPALPPTLSRQPAWTTVPSQPSLLAAGQAWTAETWATIKQHLAKLAPTTQVAGYTDGRSFTQRVVDLTNRERSIRGLPPLTVKYGLQYAAEKRSTDMIVRGYFDHIDPSGRDPFWVLRQHGMRYATAGENIAMGQRSPEDVVRDWMNSPGHRANILNPQFGAIGVSAVQNSATGQIYWTQIFTN